MSEGSEVDLSSRRDGVVIQRPTIRFRLADLLKKIDRKNLHGETDTGDVVGHEHW